MSEFNKRELFDAQIADDAKALAAKCYKCGIPMFFCAAISNTDDGRTEYGTEYVSSAKAGVELNDDHMSRHVNVLNGFDTVLPQKLDEIDITG